MNSIIASYKFFVCVLILGFIGTSVLASGMNRDKAYELTLKKQIARNALLRQQNRAEEQNFIVGHDTLFISATAKAEANQLLIDFANKYAIEYYVVFVFKVFDANSSGEDPNEIVEAEIIQNSEDIFTNSNLGNTASLLLSIQISDWIHSDISIERYFNTRLLMGREDLCDNLHEYLDSDFLSFSEGYDAAFLSYVRNIISMFEECLSNNGESTFTAQGSVPIGDIIQGDSGPIDFDDLKSKLEQVLNDPLYQGEISQVILTESTNTVSYTLTPTRATGPITLYININNESNSIEYRTEINEEEFYSEIRPPLSIETCLAELSPIRNAGLAKIGQNPELVEGSTPEERTESLLKSVIAINKSIRSLLAELKIPEWTWDSSNPNHRANNGYPISIMPPLGGAGDAALDEIKGIPEVVSLVVDFATDAQVRAQLVESISQIDFKELASSLYESKVDAYTGSGDVALYTGTKDVTVGAIFLITGGATGIRKGAKMITELTEGLTGLGTVLLKQVQRFSQEGIDVVVDAGTAKLINKQGRELALLSDEGLQLTDSRILDKIDNINDLASDISDNPALLKAIDENVGLVDSWNSFKNAGLDDLAKNPVQLQKFDDLVKSNSLGLDAKGVEDLLSAPKAKGLTWDNPEGVLDAVKRASDGNISDLSISHKKFPESGSDNFVLRNAKQYQAEASGDAALSFNKGGVSFDDIAADGKLVDRKYGHSSSIFDKVDDGFETVYEVTNQNRARSLLEQAQRQVNAVGGDGSKLRWEISTQDGANGIRQLFSDPNRLAEFPGVDQIEVVYQAQKVIK